MGRSRKNYSHNVSTTVTRSEMFLGPIPDPNSLQKYENITPGLADRIMTMAEKQQEHRIEIENRVVGSKIKDARLGVVLGFIISMTLILVSVFLIHSGNVGLGAAFIVGDIIALASTYIYGINSGRKERENKIQR